MAPVEHEETDEGWELYVRVHREQRILIGLLRRDGRVVDLREGEWPELDERKYPGAKLNAWLEQEVTRMEAERVAGPKRRKVPRKTDVSL